MTTKLTEKEVELLNDIVTNEYANGQRAANVPVWTWSVIETRSRAAVLGSLVKKGLAGRDNHGRDGDNEDACVWLTDAGFAEWQERTKIAADLDAMTKANDKLEAASDALRLIVPEPASAYEQHFNEFYGA